MQRKKKKRKEGCRRYFGKTNITKLLFFVLEHVFEKNKTHGNSLIYSSIHRTFKMYSLQIISKLLYFFKEKKHTTHNITFKFIINKIMLPLLKNK